MTLKIPLVRVGLQPGLNRGLAGLSRTWLMDKPHEKSAKVSQSLARRWLWDSPIGDINTGSSYRFDAAWLRDDTVRSWFKRRFYLGETLLLFNVAALTASWSYTSFNQGPNSYLPLCSAAPRLAPCSQLRRTGTIGHLLKVLEHPFLPLTDTANGTAAHHPVLCSTSISKVQSVTTSIPSHL